MTQLWSLIWGGATGLSCINPPLQDSLGLDLTLIALIPFCSTRPRAMRSPPVPSQVPWDLTVSGLVLQCVVHSPLTPSVNNLIAWVSDQLLPQYTFMQERNVYRLFYGESEYSPQGQT